MPDERIEGIFCIRRKTANFAPLCYDNNCSENIHLFEPQDDIPRSKKIDHQGLDRTWSI